MKNSVTNLSRAKPVLSLMPVNELLRGIKTVDSEEIGPELLG
jgi:hypothetical protein